MPYNRREFHMMKTTEKKINFKAAFSLVEMMIVVVILGLLFSLVVPAFKNNVDKTKYETSIMNLKSVAKALEQYYLQQGKYPVFKNWSEVCSEKSPLLKYISKVPQTDGWGRPYRIKSSEEQYELSGQASPNPKHKVEFPAYKITTDLHFSKEG
ncbi:MAG: hypothetical protein CR997_07710 [Acidobacteria bacterium]|nr:MAG: hypothetical protein CR997_07710 [Acidobacteriota bacterium]